MTVRKGCGERGAPASWPAWTGIVALVIVFAAVGALALLDQVM